MKKLFRLIKFLWSLQIKDDMVIIPYQMYIYALATGGFQVKTIEKGKKIFPLCGGMNDYAIANGFNYPTTDELSDSPINNIS